MLGKMIRIALADDHQQVREVWNFILSSHPGFEVVAVCRHGQEAINAAAVFTPDLFIMDINMHPVNGIDATGIITKKHPGIKVIGMSIHADSIYVKSMLDAGACGYVTKNSSYEEVVNAILQVHGGKRYICTEVQKSMPLSLMEN